MTGPRLLVRRLAVGAGRSASPRAGGRRASACMEIAGVDGVAVRDSKDLDIPPTRVSRGAWDTFLGAVATDTFVTR
ncbi:DUF397 domain-containing protein [Streptomyces sp. MS19]|uniref:DUF397 domain-containing protein n=1 Tax=Streptomyces sp. MS19 TaxID=3385972 RepID=UPI0039A0E911